MFKNFRKKVAILLSSETFDDFEKQVDGRVADLMLKFDPFEFLMKEFHGIFSEDFERPEERLDERSVLNLTMWAYKQKEDPSFTYLLEWIMNTQGNETLRHAPVTTDRILYGRAQLSTMLLFKKEIGRLSLLYEEKLKTDKVVFDPYGTDQ